MTTASQKTGRETETESQILYPRRIVSLKKSTDSLAAAISLKCVGTSGKPSPAVIGQSPCVLGKHGYLSDRPFRSERMTVQNNSCTYVRLGTKFVFVYNSASEDPPSAGVCTAVSLSCAFCLARYSSIARCFCSSVSSEFATAAAASSAAFSLL